MSDSSPEQRPRSLPRDARILYMEDDPVTARVVQKKLQRVGYEVELSPDGTAGLAECRRGEYDVALVDKNMPELDGLEVIRILGEEEGSPSTVMLTSTGDEEAAVTAMKHGASDYIVKDADGHYIELLPTVIQEVLHERELERQRRQAEEEKERLIAELKEALTNVKTLRGLLPICAHCKKIRDDSGYWEGLERYLEQHSEAAFSHGICPQCAETHYGTYYEDDETRPGAANGDEARANGGEDERT